MPMNPILELAGLQKTYDGFKAVQDVTVSVPSGTIFGLLGPNGAGKSTTIRMIMNIVGPDAGEVRFQGHPRTTADLERIGYLPEERGLYRKMTVLDQLVFLAEIHGLKRREALPKIERWLEKVELGAWAKRKIEELSKGMQQKVQLVGTVLHEPDLLILDEPFSGLDPLNQELFKELLVDYRRDGKSILFSTHGMALAEKVCDHICLIFKGRVILAGELKAVKRQFGSNAYRLVAEGDLAKLSQVPGVDQAQQREDGAVNLLLKPEAEGPEVLREMVSFLRVHEFRSADPELEQIFMKAVSDAV